MFVEEFKRMCCLHSTIYIACQSLHPQSEADPKPLVFRAIRRHCQDCILRTVLSLFNENLLNANFYFSHGIKLSKADNEVHLGGSKKLCILMH